MIGKDCKSLKIFKTFAYIDVFSRVAGNRKAMVEVSRIYLGEDGGPDGLNLLDLSGGQESLDLVGLYEDIQLVTTVGVFDEALCDIHNFGCRNPSTCDSSSLRREKNPLRELNGILHET